MSDKKNQRRSRNQRRSAESRSKGVALEKRTVPAWVPALVFVGVPLVLFREFIFSDRMLVGSDTLGLGYAARAFFADALRTFGEFPRWAPDILGGVPFLESLSGGDALYPPSLFLLVAMETYRALGWKLVLHVMGAGFFMFGWMRACGVSRVGALVAGTGFMLGPFFVTLVAPGHDGKLFVTALTPLLFWAVEKHFQRPRMWTVSGIALVVGVVLLTTHFQMAYFLFGATGLYAFYRTWTLHVESADDPESSGGPGDQDAVAGSPSSPRRLAPALRLLLFLAASVAGAGVAAVQLLPAIDYVTGSSRRVATTREAAGETSREWAASWSMHPEEAMSLVVPEFPGATGGDTAWSGNSYWGRNVFKLNSEYIGLILLVLALFSTANASGDLRTRARLRRLRGFFAALGSLALLFALGANTPVWRILYEVLPGVSLFRAPSQVIFLTGFSIASLAGWGVDALLNANDEDAPSWRGISRVLGGSALVVGLLLLLASSGLLADVWIATVHRGIDPGRAETFRGFQPLIANGAGIGLLLIAALGALAWARRSRRIGARTLLAGLVVLLVVDAGRIDRAFIRVMDFDAWRGPGPIVEVLLDRHRNDPEPYRVLSFEGNPPGQDVAPPMDGIELVAGHHPNDLNRYRQLIGMVGSGSPENLRTTNTIRSLLNVRYLIWPDYQLGPAPEANIVTRAQYPDGRVHSTLIFEPGLPRARLVGGAVVRGDDDAVPYMMSPGFDPSSEVVLPETPPITFSAASGGGTVEWLERTPNRHRLEVSADDAALLVVADNWFSGWQATVDGDPSPVLRAYHTLRAVAVPAGNSIVEFTYESSLVRLSGWLSIVVLILVAGVGVFDLRLDHRSRQVANSVAEAS